MTSPIELTPEEQVLAREAAITSLSMLPTTVAYTVRCKRTGVAIATMQLLQQAGKIPYLSQWDEMIAYHPLFSHSQNRLLAWTRKYWNLTFKNATDHVSETQKEQFCIAFMAILHSCGCLDQQCSALPSFRTVSVNMQRLLELAYWFNFLDSKRFKFPVLRINKTNANEKLEDISTYLDICGSVRNDYETNKNTAAEEERLETARRAEKMVRSGHVRAISKKMLWNWFVSSLAESNSKKYSLPEWEDWKQDSLKLWLASESVQLQYELEDVDSVEEVFLLECALGTSVSNAFKTELHKIRKNISDHLKIFEIDWAATFNQSTAQRTTEDGTVIESAGPPEPGEPPLMNAYFNRIDYLKAKAKHDVQVLQYNAWKDKGEQS